jgi:hypothetical protein
MKKLFTLFAAFAVTFSAAAQRSEPEGAAQKITAAGEQPVEESYEEKCKQLEQANEEKCKQLEQANEEKRKQLEQAIKKWSEQVDEWRRQVEGWHAQKGELPPDRPQPEERCAQLEKNCLPLEEPFNLLAEERKLPDKQLPLDNAGAVLPKQGEAPNDSIVKQRHRQRQEQIQAHKIGHFTAQLELTVEEAQAFWPVYNEYWEKRNALFTERNKLLRKVKHEKIDDKKALQMAQRLVENTQDDAKLVREYHSKLEKILPPQKLLKYYAAEDSFRVELINILRKRQKAN